MSVEEIFVIGGKEVLVDSHGAEILRTKKYHLSRKGYPCRTERPKDAKPYVLFLHNAIMNPGPGFRVDHINGNPLDNRRTNLRIVSRSQNGMNRGAQDNNTSGFKGVAWSKDKGCWCFSVRAEGQKAVQGSGFATPVEAAIAYNEAALAMHGEHAKLNLIPNYYEPQVLITKSELEFLKSKFRAAEELSFQLGESNLIAHLPSNHPLVQAIFTYNRAGID